MRGTMMAALAVALVAGGCGGDTKTSNAYIDKVNKAQSDFVAVVDNSESKIQGNGSDKETATQLGMIQAAAANVVVKLRAIKPPAKVKTLHATLVKEAQGLVTAFQKASDAYASGNPAKILTAKVDLSKDIEQVNSQMNTTITQLNNKLHG